MGETETRADEEESSFVVGVVSLTSAAMTSPTLSSSFRGGEVAVTPATPAAEVVTGSTLAWLAAAMAASTIAWLKSFSLTESEQSRISMVSSAWALLLSAMVAVGAAVVVVVVVVDAETAVEPG